MTGPRASGRCPRCCPPSQVRAPSADAALAPAALGAAMAGSSREQLSPGSLGASLLERLQRPLSMLVAGMGVGPQVGPGRR